MMTAPETNQHDSAVELPQKSVDSLRTYADTFAGITPWTGVMPIGYVANFLGVLRSQAFLIGVERAAHAYIEDTAYQVETRRPDISDGEEYFEWLDVFAAVGSAKGTFTMIELGAGYAARSVNANEVLNRLNQIPRRFVVVEGEDQHFAWAQEHFRTNHINPDDHWFIKALVNATGRPELFVHAPGRYSNMILDAPSIEELLSKIEHYNQSHAALRNVFRNGDIGAKLGVEDAYYDNVPLDIGYVSAITLNTILQPLDFVDYLDIDIQFAERTVIPASMGLISSRVKRLHIGTHTPQIHDDLLALFRDAGWRTVFDVAPQQRHTSPLGNFVTSDGILTVVNPKFDDGS